MVSFSLYLLRQGYEPEKITVLTMYSGQLIVIRSLINEIIDGRKKGPVWKPLSLGEPESADESTEPASDQPDQLPHPTNQKLKSVRVTAVDNFQGEENDVILLSLVRSNNRQKIGFLAEENRICVALSRARQGTRIELHLHININDFVEF